VEGELAEHKECFINKDMFTLSLQQFKDTEAVFKIMLKEQTKAIFSLSDPQVKLEELGLILRTVSFTID
jgi:hypothetical protein